MSAARKQGGFTQFLRDLGDFVMRHPEVTSFLERYDSEPVRVCRSCFDKRPGQAACFYAFRGTGTCVECGVPCEPANSVAVEGFK